VHKGVWPWTQGRVESLGRPRDNKCTRGRRRLSKLVLLSFMCHTLSAEARLRTTRNELSTKYTESHTLPALLLPDSLHLPFSFPLAVL